VSYGTDEEGGGSDERFDREEDLGLTKRRQRLEMISRMQMRSGCWRAGMVVCLAMCACYATSVFAATGGAKEQPGAREWRDRGSDIGRDPENGERRGFVGNVLDPELSASGGGVSGGASVRRRP